MPLYDECRQATQLSHLEVSMNSQEYRKGYYLRLTTFIKYYTMTEVVLPGLTYNTYEDYIDYLLVVGTSNDDYVHNLRKLFERLFRRTLP